MHDQELISTTLWDFVIKAPAMIYQNHESYVLDSYIIH